MAVTCDLCDNPIPSPVWENLRDGDLEYTFFICPSCGAIYPFSVTDEPLRRDIEEYTTMAQRLKEEECSEDFHRRVQKLKEKNVLRSRELAAAHPLASLFSDE